MIWVQSHHNGSPPFPPPPNIYLTNMPERNALVRSVSVSTKKRKRKRAEEESVVVNEDSVHIADKNGDRDEKTALKRPVKEAGE